MKLSVVVDGSSSNSYPVVSADGNLWYRCSDIVPHLSLKKTADILAYEIDNPGFFLKHIKSGNSSLPPVDVSSATRLLPFHPLSYRDFMLYEQHAINSARGFVKKYLPRLHPFVVSYEKLSGRTFPKLKPKKRWYKYPIYYLGNHMNFVTHGAVVKVPEYTTELDYELELGVVICKPLKNATPEAALKAIGGFVVFNDFSARDVQLDEIQCGFGPMKAKNFANAISNVVVSADEILPYIDSLIVSVTINDRIVAKTTSAGMHHTLAEAIAYASWEEQLHPGEFFGSGTIPKCSGIENGCFLTAGDRIKLVIDKIGVLENGIE